MYTISYVLFKKWLLSSPIYWYTTTDLPGDWVVAVRLGSRRQSAGASCCTQRVQDRERHPPPALSALRGPVLSPPHFFEKLKPRRSETCRTLC